MVIFSDIFSEKLVLSRALACLLTYLWFLKISQVYEARILHVNKLITSLKLHVQTWFSRLEIQAQTNYV